MVFPLLVSSTSGRWSERVGSGQHLLPRTTRTILPSLLPMPIPTPRPRPCKSSLPTHPMHQHLWHRIMHPQHLLLHPELLLMLLLQRSHTFLQVLGVLATLPLPLLPTRQLPTSTTTTTRETRETRIVRPLHLQPTHLRDRMETSAPCMPPCLFHPHLFPVPTTNA